MSIPSLIMPRKLRVSRTILIPLSRMSNPLTRLLKQITQNSKDLSRRIHSLKKILESGTLQWQLNLSRSVWQHSRKELVKIAAGFFHQIQVLSQSGTQRQLLSGTDPEPSAWSKLSLQSRELEETSLRIVIVSISQY